MKKLLKIILIEVIVVVVLFGVMELWRIHRTNRISIEREAQAQAHIEEQLEDFNSRLLRRERVETEADIIWIETSTSLLRLAGIYYTLGLRTSELEEIVTDWHNAHHQELMSYLLLSRNSSSDHVAFLTNVIDFLEENHHLFPEIPESHFEERIFPFDNLPLDVLERLLELKGISLD